MAGLRQGTDGRQASPHEGHIYKAANHGFHNDSTPALRRSGCETGVGPYAGLVQQVSQAAGNLIVSRPGMRAGK